MLRYLLFLDVSAPLNLLLFVRVRTTPSGQRSGLTERVAIVKYTIHTNEFMYAYRVRDI